MIDGQMRICYSILCIKGLSNKKIQIVGGIRYAEDNNYAQYDQ